MPHPTADLHPPPPRRATAARAAVAALGFGLAVSLGLGAGTATAADPASNPRWQQLVEHYFPGQEVTPAADGLITFEAPNRAQDAALVPMSVTVDPALEAERLHLIIDNNPVPLAAVFRFGPAHAPGPVETRVRVDRYTFVHAVVETRDGRLLTAERFVKASGGCSAPAVRDPAEAAARLGKMRVRLPERITAGEAVTAQVMISHPNNSGLQFDQITRFYIPPHYLTDITVTYDGVPILTIDADISISEDPSFRFTFVAEAGGVLAVTARDSKGMEFADQWQVQVEPAS